jgi:hypothetical protein
VDKYHETITGIIVKVVGELGSSKLSVPGFDNDVFKKELTSGLNACLENEKLTSEFGKLWLAEGNTLVEAVEAIAEAMMLSMIREALLGRMSDTSSDEDGDKESLASLLARQRAEN